MKTMQELYSEIMASDELKKDFVEAMKAEKLGDFLKAHDCEATEAEIREFVETKAAEDIPIELSEDEIKHVVGGSGIAEYYLSTGNRDAAGRVLGTICGHGLLEGGRQGFFSNASGNAVATLFNGVCGIGYELLRYAYPDTILSVL